MANMKFEDDVIILGHQEYNLNRGVRDLLVGFPEIEHFIV